MVILGFCNHLYTFYSLCGRSLNTGSCGSCGGKFNCIDKFGRSLNTGGCGCCAGKFNCIDKVTHNLYFILYVTLSTLYAEGP